MAEPEDRRRSFGLFALDAARGASPLYAALASSIADEEIVCEIVSLRREGQPAPNMLFAAAHFLILRGADHPLREYYRSAGGDRRPDDALAAAFLDFCRAHEPALKALVAARATNTNEAGRSALIAAGLASLARIGEKPLYLIELGPSAGLNLNFDRYAYRFTGAGNETLSAFWAPSRLTIDCMAKGAAVPDLGPAPPAIARRTGLEREPVDLSDPDDRDWLRALVWPERAERHLRLAAALEIAQEFPPPIEKADAVAGLAAALAGEPAGAETCVFHTAVTYQFSEKARAALDAVFDEASHQRRLSPLALEWREGDIYPLTLTRYERGLADETLLALCDPHGRWIEWRGLKGWGRL